jgi:beta-fructofuranosidase
MPNLVEVPFDDDSRQKKWVLFLSIGPGAPLGGSFTQYYIGHFDGTTFSSDDNYLRTADLGKDWYAAQTWFNPPDGEAYGIGWASNWQYCNRVPAYQYRSAMSLPRKFTIREVPLNESTKSMSLITRPIDLSIARLPSNDTKVNANGSPSISPFIEAIYQRHMQGSTGAFEFKINIMSVISPARVTADISNYSGHSIQLNFVVDDQGMFISMDRGRIRTGSSWDDPLFDDKVCMWVPNTQSVYDVHVIIDAYVCELFAIDGAYAFTNTFFLKDGVASSLTVSQNGADAEVFDVYELGPLASG